MKKYISFALLIVLTISLLAGCRGNMTDETMTTGTNSTTNTTASTSTTTKPSTTESTNNTTGTTDSSRSRYPSAIMD